MLKFKGLLVIALVMTMALAGPALAQPGPGGGMGRGMGPVVYNPQTVTTVTGLVEKLADLPSLGRGGGKGMQYRGVLLKTDQGSLMVDLAPGWYLNQKKFVVQAGATVSATGSKVTLDNQPGLIAREVTVNGTTLKLRDEQGVPVWQRSGPGGGMGKGMKSGRGQGQGPPPR
ncbi:MAG: hypothetical protein L6277_17300 [Desulfobacterales bacterium]|nr:hypothetical protein [Pseudomonadota bacterium]MBU4356326.1 hypothetical protein [Pseudomonadota bacterium]MCG2773830.1 hypothetical protein [Desulfobacterales bacterium]